MNYKNFWMFSPCYTNIKWNIGVGCIIHSPIASYYLSMSCDAPLYRRSPILELL